jgi:hypothetical protein
MFMVKKEVFEWIRTGQKNIELGGYLQMERKRTKPNYNRAMHARCDVFPKTFLFVQRSQSGFVQFSFPSGSSLVVVV